MNLPFSSCVEFGVAAGIAGLGIGYGGNPAGCVALGFIAGKFSSVFMNAAIADYIAPPALGVALGTAAAYAIPALTA